MKKWIVLATLMATGLSTALLAGNALAANDAHGDGHDEAVGEVFQPVTGDPEAGKAAAAVCGACHGGNGMAIQAEYPNLAGQHVSYIVKQLSNYRDGSRENAIMAPQAANLSDDDILNIAAYFSAMPKMQGVASEDTLTQGKAIYQGGIADAGIAACSGCHGPSGLGNPAAGYPMLGGQNAAYTALQLKAFRSGARANDTNSMMRTLAHRLTDEEIDTVANYIAGLIPNRTP